ncbi:hypothetical protein [Bacillus sp. B-jedd]|nr:hypothetical protein [Bacillus sp. B-jedd]CEG26573.1 hypothetical protein BN1002_01421 [Bacillus sp. B-jedd]
MSVNNDKEKSDSLEQEKKEKLGKDIEPERNPFKPQEECTDKK